MKKTLIALCSAAVLFSACSKNDDKNPPVVNPGDTSVVILSGDISSDKTLSAAHKYKLQGFVYITDGATLHIEPGTVIVGDKSTKGTLVITRGAKIHAEGTPDKPIVFTSAFASGARGQGDWGGLILLGKAPVNAAGGEARIEGGLTATNGGDEKKYTYYGGTDVNDNSGVLKYVRIEFGGIAFSPDNEINGLTMAGVGAGTTISYVQVYRSGDDAYEWFGGTVNCDHLVATYSWDDDFDTDFGYSGKVQFGVAQRAKSIADFSGSNGFESDNDGNGSAALPQTQALFSNMTIIGPISSGNSTKGINANFQHGAQIRRNSSQSIINSVFAGFPVGLYIDDSKGIATSGNIAAGTLHFRNNIIAGCPVSFKSDNAWAGAATWFATTNTTELTNVEDVNMMDAYRFSGALQTPAGRPDYRLAAGAVALSGADFTGVTGFETVSFRGAFDGSDDWTQGWTNFEAENTAY